MYNDFAKVLNLAHGGKMNIKEDKKFDLGLNNGLSDREIDLHNSQLDLKFGSLDYIYGSIGIKDLNDGRWVEFYRISTKAPKLLWKTTHMNFGIEGWPGKAESNEIKLSKEDIKNIKAIANWWLNQEHKCSVCGEEACETIIDGVEYRDCQPETYAKALEKGMVE